MDSPEFYCKKIKEFEEGINQNHTARIQNIRIGPKFVIIDLYLKPIPADRLKGVSLDDNMPMSVYEDCKYIRAELDNGKINDRDYKSREDEF